MGMLDDAIREHLELKRRRGADAGEVAREQREALDPEVRDEPVALGGEAETPQEPAGHEEELGIAPDETVVDHGLAEEPLSEGSGYGGSADRSPSTLAEETAELDMQIVLDEDEDPARPSTSADPASAHSSAHDRSSLPPHEGETSAHDEEEFSDTHREVPGQERLSFE